MTIAHLVLYFIDDLHYNLPNPAAGDYSYPQHRPSQQPHDTPVIIKDQRNHRKVRLN